MPCYSPLTGWRSRRPNSNGKYPITFVKSEGYSDKEMTLPCGQCTGCRLEHSRQWALRCVHESQMHEQNCFITLTYSDEHLPRLENGEPTLNKRHLQLFMKRLRKKFGNGIKFYACGEYGEETSRPHYHACLFGVDFDDKLHFSTKNGNKLYVSEELIKLWPFGQSSIGEMNFETAAYTARYCMKKHKGKNWQDHYERYTNLETGEIVSLQPEFALMSRRPGIGKSWLDTYKKEVLSSDSVVLRGKEMKPSKYYDNQLEKSDEQKYLTNKAKRRAAAKNAIYNNSLARLYVRGKCKEQQIKTLKKEL